MRVPVFSVSPDPTCMYQTPAVKNAVAKIRRAIALKQGLSCIFGDVGSGKSSLVRHIASSFDHNENFRVAMIAEKTNAPVPGFLKAVAKEFEIPIQRSAIAQMDAIQEFLMCQHLEGRTVIMMIDEAQLLRLETMESIRSVLNYETHTEKLAQVVLAGQLELRDRMMTRRYRAFRSRIVAPVVLEMFTQEETAAMIAFRHEYWQVPNRFTPGAMLRVHELTHGIPRDTVIICGYAYSYADDHKLDLIESDVIDRAAVNLRMNSERETVAAI